MRKLKQRKANTLRAIQEKREAAQAAQKEKDGDWEDVDEHEKEVFATTGYFDVPDSEAHISLADQKLLERMENKQAEMKMDSGEKNLADLIMQKMETGDFVDGDKLDSMSTLEAAGSNLDPKVVQAYRKVGVVMRSYKSGKLPKAFKIIPQTQNWEELLLLTNPEKWSPHSTFEATKIFSSQLNAKMAQRFYNVILLPNVKENIETYKKLNYHLYMAVKKAMFKTGAFFKGFLIPMAKDASTREAIIIGSILTKMSINALDVAAALVKLSTFEYTLGTGYFIKVLLSKRYTLPTMVLEKMIDYFCTVGMGHKSEEEVEADDEEGMEDEAQTNDGGFIRDMPVMWH